MFEQFSALQSKFLHIRTIFACWSYFVQAIAIFCLSGSTLSCHSRTSACIGGLHSPENNYYEYKYGGLRKGRRPIKKKKTFLNGHCPDRSYPHPPLAPPTGRGNGQRGPFFGRQKRHLARITESNSN